MKHLICILSFFLMMPLSYAAGPSQTYSNPYEFLLVMVFLIAVLMLITAAVLLHVSRVLEKSFKHPVVLTEEKPVPMMEYDEWKALQKSKPSVWNRLLGLRPLSDEKDMMLEHDFDGITELDNPTPTWFMGLFYGTIAFAIVYLLNYHVFMWRPLQDEEYAIEVKAAEKAKNAFLAKSGNLIDENNVKVVKDAGVLADGKAIYLQNCIACHGDKGQGSIGPNLTDEYWIHGGTVNHIFKTVKYGVPEKGMIAWEKSLTPKQTSDVVNFILSLQGTKPENAKEAQGEKLN